MGRPLKIAKAQAILTLTATNGTTEVVTVSQTLADYGIIAGMPFTVATTTGGLTAGTTYWVLRVTGASTFTVSATPLNANPTNTPVNLTNAGPVTVALTVGAVDTGFNNPSGSGNTYSVVGGNTSIYGNQVLVGVAIGITGSGVIYSSDADANVFGVGTDFATELSVGSTVQVAVANINGRTDYVDLGTVSANTGTITVAVANTQNTGNIIGTSGNAETLYVDAPVRFTANLGGLVAGTTYFVKNIANASAFTVSLSPAGAEVDLSNATGTPDAQQEVLELAANAAVTASAASYIYADAEAGYIVRQKGKQKYLVKGTTTGLTAQCLTANVANAALTPNTMNILGTYANSATVNIQSISDHTAELFTATSGPVATDNIVLANANPAFVTFNTAAVANASAGMPYPLVTVNKS